MAASIFFFVFFISLSSSLSSSVHSDTNTIRTICRSTRHYDLCVSSLKSNSTTSTADSKDLLAILAGVAAENATASAAAFRNYSTSSAASRDADLKKALTGCAEKYGSAAGALTEAVENLRKEREEEGFDYANVNAMAAEEYAKGCRNGFGKYKKSLYTAEIGRRETYLRRICDVVLDIISYIGF